MSEEEKMLIRKVHSVNISKHNFVFASTGLILLVTALLF